MIRGGAGKLKGRRNRRRQRPPDWRFYTRIEPIALTEFEISVFAYLQTVRDEVAREFST